MQKLLKTRCKEVPQSLGGSRFFKRCAKITTKNDRIFVSSRNLVFVTKLSVSILYQNLAPVEHSCDFSVSCRCMRLTER